MPSTFRITLKARHQTSQVLTIISQTEAGNDMSEGGGNVPPSSGPPHTRDTGVGVNLETEDDDDDYDYDDDYDDDDYDDDDEKEMLVDSLMCFIAAVVKSVLIVIVPQL